MASEHSRIMACSDCMIVIANGDMPPDTDDVRDEEINAGINALPGHAVVGDDEDEFSRRACGCCGTMLGGSRHEIVIFERDAPVAAEVPVHLYDPYIQEVSR